MIFGSMFSYSDMNLSDSESEVEFPPPRRVSTAPPPTRNTRYVIVSKYFLKVYKQHKQAKIHQ